MKKSLFNSLPIGEWACWDRPPVMYVPDHDVFVRTVGSAEGHSPKSPVPLRGWGIFGFWIYDVRTRRWTWMQPRQSMGPLTYDTRRRVVLGYRGSSG